MNLAEVVSVSGIRQRMRKGESVSLSNEESETIDWIITRQHYELPPETIICTPAQVEDLRNFTECIGEGHLTPATANFVNWIRQKVQLFRHVVIWLTPREAEIIEEIKLRFRPEAHGRFRSMRMASKKMTIRTSLKSMMIQRQGRSHEKTTNSSSGFGVPSIGLIDLNPLFRDLLRRDGSAASTPRAHAFRRLIRSSW